MSDLANALYTDMMRAWNRANDFRAVEPPEPAPCPFAGYAGPTPDMCAGCPSAADCPDAVCGDGEEVDEDDASA